MSASPVSPKDAGKEIRSRRRGLTLRPGPLHLFQSSTQALVEHRVAEIGRTAGALSANVFQDENDFKVNAADTFADNRDAYFHHAVFDRIDTHLLMETRLAQYQHLGRVLLFFETDSHGLLLPASLKVSSNDSVLKVHILKAVRWALAKSLPESLFLKSGSSVFFKAQFDFAFGDPQMNRQKQQVFAKPILNFARYTAERPAATTLSEPIEDFGKDVLMGKGSDAVLQLIGSLADYRQRKKMREHESDPFWDYRTDPDYNL